MTWAAVNRHGDVNAAAIAEADAIASPVKHSHLGAYSSGLNDAANSIMATRLTGNTAHKHQLTFEIDKACKHCLQGHKDCSEWRLLLAQSLAENDFAGQPIRRADAHLASIRIRHRRC